MEISQEVGDAAFYRKWRQGWDGQRQAAALICSEIANEDLPDDINGDDLGIDTLPLAS